MIDFDKLVTLKGKFYYQPRNCEFQCASKLDILGSRSDSLPIYLFSICHTKLGT